MQAVRCMGLRKLAVLLIVTLNWRKDLSQSFVEAVVIVKHAVAQPIARRSPWRSKPLAMLIMLSVAICPVVVDVDVPMEVPLIEKNVECGALAEHDVESESLKVEVGEKAR